MPRTLFPAAEPVAYARIAVERSLDRHPEGLTYGVPPTLSDLVPGDRVLVPLGRADRPTPGYVIEVGATCPVDPDTVKLIGGRDRAAVRLPPGLLELAMWISRYYCAPIGTTLANVLPAAVKRNVGAVSRTLVDLGDPPPPETKPKLSPQQRQVLETLSRLEDHRRPVDIRTLADLAEIKTTGPIRRLLDAGYLRGLRRSSVEARWMRHGMAQPAPARLTPAQEAVVEAIGQRLDHGFSAHLLFGVTGSGKTEVYFRLIERVLAAGRAVIMLVPEISLTPQTGGRLVGRFPEHRVAILHSGLTAAQRHQQWATVAEGSAPVVLGARSAVFAPFPDERLGLVIVDEEHDASYKQDQAPRYHGRDVAIRRAQLADCPVLLGSATPSVESWLNATEHGLYHLHRLRERVPGMCPPKVHVVDFARQCRPRPGGGVRLIGPVLEQGITATLDGGGQVLLLLNRRGYANYITCPSSRCPWVMTCDQCDVTMVYHRNRSLPSGGFVQCHHCLAEQRLPDGCPDCGGRIVTFGLGTQRVEEELTRTFPALTSGQTLRRVDSDTMRSGQDFHELLEQFGAGAIRMLVGTQIIAKGLDYPGVRLVGVINADTALNLPDFRASERTFQLVSQVAGRCGRTTDPGGAGTVIVQSFNPTTAAIRLAAAHDYPTFAAAEIEARRAGGLPPVTRMTRIVVRDADRGRCIQHADALALALRRVAGAGVQVRGPADCPIARIAGRHRQQVELIAPTAAIMQRLLAGARNAGLLVDTAAIAVDVDPLALL